VSYTVINCLFSQSKAIGIGANAARHDEEIVYTLQVIGGFKSEEMSEYA